MCNTSQFAILGHCYLLPGGVIIRGLLLGDAEVGQEALIRFYVLHVAVLPLVLTTFIAVHFFRIRKDGGLARPDDTSHEKLIPDEECGDVRNNSVFNNTRSYKLVEVVKGNAPKVNEEVDQMVFSWPKLITRELIVLLFVVGIMSIIAIYCQAPLEAPADPNHPTNPAKAPWYFLGLQELVSYNAFIGGVALPGLIVGLLFMFPYIEIFVETLFNLKRKDTAGIWFAKERNLENIIFLSIFFGMIFLIIIGSLFRGPNWEFMYPWEITHMGGH